MLLRLGRHYPGKQDLERRHMDLAREPEARAPPSSASRSRRCCWRCVRRRSASRGWSRRSARRCRTGRWRRSCRRCMAMRGIDLVSAVTFLAEIGDLSRFAEPAPADGAISAWCRRERSTGDERQARSDHQGRQRPGAAHAGRVRLELSPSAAGRQGEAGARSRRRRVPCRRSPGRRSPALRALPGIVAQGQAADGRRHRDRPRAGGLHLGHRSRGRRPSRRRPATREPS